MQTRPDTLPKLLIVDDDDDVRQTLQELLEDRFEVEAVSSGTAALAMIRAKPFDAVLSDVKMPEMDGIAFLGVVKDQHPSLPIVLLTGYSDKSMVIEALRHHAFDFYEKPVDVERLATALMRAVEYKRERDRISALRSRFEDARREVEASAHELEELYASSAFKEALEAALPPTFAPLLGRDEGLRAKLHYAAAIASTPLPVLVCGEVGTGRRTLARALHDASGRKGPFVTVMTGSLEADALTAALIGTATQPGLLATAEGGTLFIDEIRALEGEAQLAVLRVIEAGEYTSADGTRTVRSSARIVASTCGDVDNAVRQGTFRSDLFHRLKAHLVELPPLRARKGDLPMLFTHFVAETAKELGRPVPAYPKEILTLLANYSFPSNLGELRAMTHDAVQRARGGMLSLKSFEERMTPEEVLATAGDAGELRIVIAPDRPIPTLKDAEELLVEEALRRAEGNQGIAARMLGLSRQALNKRLIRGKQVEKVATPPPKKIRAAS